MPAPFSKVNVQHHFDRWDALKEQIHTCYAERNPEVRQLVKEGVILFRQLLQDGGQMKEGEQSIDKLMPLNGEERLQFIEAQRHHHHAFIQLAALFEETEKKAARLTITERKRP